MINNLSDFLGLPDSIGTDTLPTDRPWRVKMGFDPTAPDLHFGHAIGLLALRKLQDAGHHVILVVGDFTASIGDPTGRNDMRPELSREQILSNAKTYAEQAMKILRSDRCEVVFNSSWLDKLGTAGMIKLASKTTISQMLARDDFAKRYKDQVPIGAHEILYPLLQGQDSVELCPDLEFGGTDQRFNLLMGRELMKAAGQKPQSCAMVSLLVGLDGKKKMSKSLGNHIGLTEPAHEVFAKTMSISDEAMEQWGQTLRAFGARDGWVDGDPMESKKRLGSWMVEKLHPGVGQSARLNWEASRQHNNWESVADQKSLSVPADGQPWASVLRDWGWESSAGMARERISQGALRLDEVKITDPKARATPGLTGLLRYGSKRVAKIHVEQGLGDAAEVKDSPKKTSGPKP